MRISASEHREIFDSHCRWDRSTGRSCEGYTGVRRISRHSTEDRALRPIACLLLTALALPVQTLQGVVDIHVHSDPDSVPRSIDAVDIAKLAKQRGIRALLLKNHYEPTASLAFLVRKEVPGIALFGGIALNLTVGGVNPAAVDRMTRVRAGWGRVVWMPTFDAENQVKFSKENRPFASVSNAFRCTGRA